MAKDLEYSGDVGGSFATACSEKERFHPARGLRSGLPSQSSSFANLAGSSSHRRPTSRLTGLPKNASTEPNTRGGGCKTDSLKEAGAETLPASYQRPEYGCGFRWVRCAKGWDKRGLTRKTTSLFLGSGQCELFTGLLCSDLQGIPLPS